MITATLIETQLLALYAASVYLTIIPILILGAILSHIAIGALRKSREPDQTAYNPYDPHRQKVFYVSDDEIRRLFEK